MVDAAVDVAHLVGVDENGAVIAHLACHKAAELALTGNVEPVGRLVHQHKAGVSGKGKAHEHFLLLSHRERRERLDFGIDVEDCEVVKHVVVAETRVECTIEGGKLAQRHSRHLKLLGHHIHVGEGRGAAQAHVGATHCHSAGFGREQARHEVDESGFAGTV